MPQSADFWIWAKQMHEHETQTPPDERVYLCILYLENRQREDDEQQVERVAESLEVDLSDRALRKSPSFSSIVDDDTDADLLDYKPRGRPALANTPTSLLRKGVRLTMPNIVRKWHEIGTVNRHWAMEVRGQVYELYRTRAIAKFRRRPVSQVPRISERLTARMYVGRTHMVDDVLLEIAKGLISLQRHYEVQMDNCQHFVAVFLPRILCASHCHMTVLPSASLPYIKHSQFGLLLAGVKEGKLSTTYHRFLHETKNLVWQHSVYYFKVNEDYVPNCATLTKNPYKAVSRLIRGNFSGRHQEKCSRRVQEQKSVTWRDYWREGNVRMLGEGEAMSLFRDTVWPPRQGTVGTWVMHHINDWTEFLGWTPQMFNEWLLANEHETTLLIKFPEEYFSQARQRLSHVSLEVGSDSGTYTPRSLDATTETWYRESSDATSEICVDLEEGQCSCSICQDRILAQAIFESTEELERIDRLRQEADDMTLARVISAREDDLSTNRYQQEMDDMTLARVISVREDNLSTNRYQQEMDDKHLAQVLVAHEDEVIDTIRIAKLEQIAQDLEIARSYGCSRRSSMIQDTIRELEVGEMILEVDLVGSAIEEQIRDDEELARAFARQESWGSIVA